MEKGLRRAELATLPLRNETHRLRGGCGVASFLQRLRTELVPSWWLGDSQRQGQGQG